jgi:hypothetical protein
VRDLVRARATAAVRVTDKSRQFLRGFLFPHGRIYPGKKDWKKAYQRRLTTVRFAHAVSNPRMRACQRLSSIPCPTLHIHTMLRPVLPEEVAMKQGVDSAHESRVLGKWVFGLIWGL